MSLKRGRIYGVNVEERRLRIAVGPGFHDLKYVYTKALEVEIIDAMRDGKLVRLTVEQGVVVAVDSAPEGVDDDSLE